MSRFLISLICCFAVIAHANAADYYAPPPAPEPQPVFQPPPPPPQKWNGCYAGANVGVNLNYTTYKNDPINVYTDANNYDLSKYIYDQSIYKSSPMIGGTLGCDISFGNWLIGGLIDANMNLSQTKTMLGGADPYSDLVTAKNMFNSDLAIRFGYTFDTTLIFAKIGVGMSEFRYADIFQASSVRYSVDQCTSASPPVCSYLPNWLFHLSGEDASSHLHFAPLLGIGAEHMLSDHWSLSGGIDVMYFSNTADKLQVLSSSFRTPGATSETLTNYLTGSTYGYSASSVLTNLKIGVNYRF